MRRDLHGHSSKRALSICVIVGVVFALAAPGALARAGDPDPSFSADGRTVADVALLANAFSTSMAIDSRGRIVVAGYIARPAHLWAILARFNSDGSLDQGFGEGGVVRPEWGGLGPINGVAIDGSGRIVLVGSYQEFPLFPYPNVFTDYDFAVARLLESGAPDRSFAGDGLLTLDGGSRGHDFGSDLALDAEGRILLSGTMSSQSSGNRLAALRVTDAGVPDPSFDGDGISSIDFGEPGAAETIAIDPQGRVVVAGNATVAGSQEFAVARLDAGGQPDPSLDGDGRAALDFGTQPGVNVAADVAVDALGRLVLVGGAGYGSEGLALVGRLLPNGSPDPSLDGDGRLTLGLSGPARAEGVAIDRDGRILVVGTRGERESEEAFLARLEPDGLLDPSFGMGGIVRENFLGRVARGAAVTTDSVGRYLIAGSVYGSEVNGFALARYLHDDEPAAEIRCRGKRATIIGTSQADTLQGTRRRDVIVAFSGNDRIRSLRGRDLICAGRGRDFVQAGAGDDRAFGGSGNDRLFGQAGRDRLWGGRGNDRLAGGAGRDPLRGGPGRDIER